MNRKIYYWKLRGSEMQLGERTLIMGVLNHHARLFFRRRPLQRSRSRLRPRARTGRAGRRHHRHRSGIDQAGIAPNHRRRGMAAAGPGSQAPERQPARAAFAGYVQIRDRRTSAAIRRRNLQRSERADLRSGYGESRRTGQCRPDSESHERPAGNMGEAPPMQDAMGTIARDLDADHQSCPPRRRRSRANRNRSGSWLRQAKGTERGDSRAFKKLAELDYPILVGPSRKSFLAQPSENETLFATAAAVAAAVLNGAHIVRVHDVQEMHAVVQVAEEIAKAAAAVARVEERPAAVRPPRPQRSQSGPEFIAERPRPPRPPLSRPAVPKPPVPKPQEEAPPRREFRPAAPPRDRRDDRRDDRRPAAPKSFRGPERRDDRPPRGFAPPRKSGGRPGGDNRPPKRPFRKRP